MRFAADDHRARVTPDLLEGDAIQPGHPLFGIIWINPERMSGAPCFFGTRVPVQILLDYLRGGDSIEDFLDGYPPITRQHVDEVLTHLPEGLAGYQPRERAA